MLTRHSWRHFRVTPWSMVNFAENYFLLLDKNINYDIRRSWKPNRDWVTWFLPYYTAGRSDHLISLCLTTGRPLGVICKTKAKLLFTSCISLGFTAALGTNYIATVGSEILCWNDGPVSLQVSLCQRVTPHPCWYTAQQHWRTLISQNSGDVSNVSTLKEAGIRTFALTLTCRRRRGGACAVQITVATGPFAVEKEIQRFLKVDNISFPLIYSVLCHSWATAVQSQTNPWAPPTFCHALFSDAEKLKLFWKHFYSQNNKNNPDSLCYA